MAETFHKVATAGELGNEEARHVDIGKQEIGLFRIGDEFFALDDVCTHAYARLSEGWIEGGEVVCPLHAGRFDLRSGKACGLPCTENIKTYPVRRDGDDILVGV